MGHIVLQWILTISSYRLNVNLIRLNFRGTKRLQLLAEGGRVANLEAEKPKSLQIIIFDYFIAKFCHSNSSSFSELKQLRE